MVQVSFVIVETEEQRANGVVTALVPSESGDNAIGGARVLDLEHRTRAGHVRLRVRLGNDAIEAGTFKTFEPLRGNLAIACHRRQVDRRLHLREETLEFAAAFALRLCENRFAI